MKTATTKTVGGFDFSESVEDGKLVLRFSMEGKYQDGSTYKRDPVLLASAIRDAFKFKYDAPARAEADRREREGEGVDGVLLAKMQRDISKLMEKYNRKTIQRTKALQAAVRSFTKGEPVTIKENVKDLGGKPGTVLEIRNKYVLVEVEGKKWRVGPSLLVKTEGK